MNAMALVSGRTTAQKHNSCTTTKCHDNIHEATRRASTHQLHTDLFSTLPLELLRAIVSQLSLPDAASLALTSRSTFHSICPALGRASRLKHTRRKLFLRLDRSLPTQLFCLHCDAFHPRNPAAEEVLVLDDRTKCGSELIRLTRNIFLNRDVAMLAARALHHESPAHGVLLAALKGAFDSPESERAQLKDRLDSRIVDGLLLVRLQRRGEARDGERLGRRTGEDEWGFKHTRRMGLGGDGKQYVIEERYMEVGEGCWTPDYDLSGGIGRRPVVVLKDCDEEDYVHHHTGEVLHPAPRRALHK